MKKKFKTRGPKPVALETLFWDHVQRGGADECWLWEGATTPFGYGDIKSHQRRHNAHRVSYELHKGPIPQGMQVCHRCDNPRCCNPGHLWLGTAGDNCRDMVAKGRHVSPALKGSKNGRAILTDALVMEIRRDKRPGTQIAADLGLGITTVNSIRRGASWKHLPMPADAPTIRIGRPRSNTEAAA